YSAFLLYCANDDLKTPNYDQCIKFFNEFLTLHEKCINGIKDNRKVVMNSGIKINRMNITKKTA
ncbi:hypothetical protein NC661_11160, partial [Aquibacillus koreensis]